MKMKEQNKKKRVSNKWKDKSTRKSWVFSTFSFTTLDKSTRGDYNIKRTITTVVSDVIVIREYMAT